MSTVPNQTEVTMWQLLYKDTGRDNIHPMDLQPEQEGIETLEDLL